MSQLLDGKTGLVMGVANKRSIAWAIANAARPSEDAELADLLDGLGNPELAGLLAASTAVLVVASQWFYRYSVRRAWRRGRIEETTGM